MNAILALVIVVAPIACQDARDSIATFADDDGGRPLKFSQKSIAGLTEIWIGQSPKTMPRPMAPAAWKNIDRMRSGIVFPIAGMTGLEIGLIDSRPDIGSSDHDRPSLRVRFACASA